MVLANQFTMHFVKHVPSQVLTWWTDVHHCYKDDLSNCSTHAMDRRGGDTLEMAAMAAAAAQALAAIALYRYCSSNATSPDCNLLSPGTVAAVQQRQQLQQTV